MIRNLMIVKNQLAFMEIKIENCDFIASTSSAQCILHQRFPFCDALYSPLRTKITQSSATQILRLSLNSSFSSVLIVIQLCRIHIAINQINWQILYICYNRFLFSSSLIAIHVAAAAACGKNLRHSISSLPPPPSFLYH